MIRLGEINELFILRDTSVGLFLGDDEDNEVLLPNKFVPDEWEIDEEIEVFVFKDSENRICATTETPLITVDHFAKLKVVHNTRVGSFMDWGLDKDLLVPFKEQHDKLEEGKSYIVFLLHDEASDRLIGSTNWHKFLRPADDGIKVGEEVSIIPFEDISIGMKVIVNHYYKGIVYRDEVFEDFRWGEERNAFIKRIRPDGKIDISLKKPGYEHVAGESDKILQILRRNGGFLNLNDKSAPDEIYEVLNMSKKSFKKALGALYKARLIIIEKDGIKLLE